MTTQATTASVLESSLRPVRAQLDLAIEQTTGTAQRSIESATVLLNQAQSLCIEQLNIETDDYNLLFDRLEQAENDLTTKSLTLTQVQERIENAELSVAEANAQRDSISAKYNLSLSDQRVLATEVNRLKSLNPEKMKIQIVRLKDDLEHKRTLLNQQLTEIRRYKKEVAEKTSKLAVMVNVNDQLNSAVSDLTARIQRMDGDVEPTYYRGHDGTEFYFYTFQWGLKLRSGDYDMQLINDIDWHIEIRSTSGIGLIVSVNEWALPVYPMVDDFKQNWPDGLTPAVTQRIRDLLEPTHPHLVTRAEWAESLRLEIMNATVGDIIEKCLNNSKSEYLISSSNKSSGREPGALNADSLTKAFVKALKATDLVYKISPPSFHEIRSLASRLYEAEYGKEFAQKLLGHKSMKMTNVYLDSRKNEWVEI